MDRESNPILQGIPESLPPGAPPRRCALCGAPRCRPLLAATNPRFAQSRRPADGLTHLPGVADGLRRTTCFILNPMVCPLRYVLVALSASLAVVFAVLAYWSEASSNTGASSSSGEREADAGACCAHLSDEPPGRRKQKQTQANKRCFAWNDLMDLGMWQLYASTAVAFLVDGLTGRYLYDVVIGKRTEWSTNKTK